MQKLPTIRRGERAAYYRCPKMWYWAWRKGLVPKTKQFGALDLGSWMHLALAEWYGRGYRRNGDLKAIFHAHAMNAISNAIEEGAPQYTIEKAEELLSLGEAMAEAYQVHYGSDPKVYVLTAEIPLEFTISGEDGEIIAIHKLKPDLVFVDSNRDVWLMEHKTAGSIRTEHLVIDNQARPYGAMAERSLTKLGYLKRGQQFKGILYNFLRKGLPDLRPTDAKGYALNKDGSVSKRQPAALFLRKPIVMSRKAKIITLRRLQQDAILLTMLTQSLKEGSIKAADIPKTPHYSCPKICPFFTLCVAEEEGTDIRHMERALYVRRDPYIYEEETTDEFAGFEMR